MSRKPSMAGGSVVHPFSAEDELARSDPLGGAIVVAATQPVVVRRMPATDDTFSVVSSRLLIGERPI